MRTKKKQKNMKTVKIVVEQHALRTVRVKRRLVLEIEENQSLDPALLGRDIKEGEEDFGPFPWDPVEGSEYMEPSRLRVVGMTDEVADIPTVSRHRVPLNPVVQGQGPTPSDQPSATTESCIREQEVGT